MSDISMMTRRVIAAMDEIRNLAPYCSSNTIVAFLTVAIDPGATVGQVQVACGMPPGATARALSILFPRARGKDGLGLIESKIDHNDARVKHLYLTNRGHQVWNRIERVLAA